MTAAVARFLRETMLELNAWTGFAGQFSQLSEGTARFENLPISIAEVLPAESCNTGPEPLVRAEGCVVFPLDGDPVVLTWAHLRVMRAATSGRAPLASADNATSTVVDTTRQPTDPSTGRGATPPREDPARNGS